MLLPTLKHLPISIFSRLCALTISSTLPHFLLLPHFPLPLCKYLISIGPKHSHPAGPSCITFRRSAVYFCMLQSHFLYLSIYFSYFYLLSQLRALLHLLSLMNPILHYSATISFELFTFIKISSDSLRIHLSALFFYYSMLSIVRHF